MTEKRMTLPRLGVIVGTLIGLPAFAFASARVFFWIFETERGYGWTLIYVLPAIPFYITFVLAAVVLALLKTSRNEQVGLRYLLASCGVIMLYWLVNAIGILFCTHC